MTHAPAIQALIDVSKRALTELRHLRALPGADTDEAFKLRLNLAAAIAELEKQGGVKP